MARSYLPSKVSEIVAIWKKDLSKVGVSLILSFLICIHLLNFWHLGPNIWRDGHLRDLLELQNHLDLIFI